MEMNTTQKINIKKKKAPYPVYWGVHTATGELLSINDVPRGKKCNCKCIACGTELSARQGEVNAHHFAHVYNNDCYYGSEIAIYHALYERIRRDLKFYVPEAILKFNSKKEPETVAEATITELTDVKMDDYDPAHYPPELICCKGEHRFRVVINFESYYNENDYKQFQEYGKQCDVSVLVVDVDNLSHTISSLDIEKLINDLSGKKWIYSKVIDIFRTRYKNAAAIPPIWNDRYLCPAQRGKYQNVYSVVKVTCYTCPYCYDKSAERFCLAVNYINHVKDFKKEKSQREEEFRSENKLRPIKKISEYPCPICGAPLVRRTKNNNPKAVFAGCSSYPQCKGSHSVEPITEQVIIAPKK